MGAGGGRPGRGPRRGPSSGCQRCPWGLPGRPSTRAAWHRWWLPGATRPWSPGGACPCRPALPRGRAGPTGLMRGEGAPRRLYPPPLRATPGRDGEGGCGLAPVVTRAERGGGPAPAEHRAGVPAGPRTPPHRHGTLVLSDPGGNSVFGRSLARVGASSPTFVSDGPCRPTDGRSPGPAILPPMRASDRSERERTHQLSRNHLSELPARVTTPGSRRSARSRSPCRSPEPSPR